MAFSLSNISTWYGNSPTSLAVALGLWIAAILGLVLAQRVLIRRLERRAKSTNTEIDNFLAAMLAKTRFIFVLFIAMLLASATLNLPPRLRMAVGIVGKLALLIQFAFWGGELIVAIFARYFSRSRDGGASTTVEAISYAARLLLWVLILLVGLESFGIHVTAIVAGLGIGGLAIALAVQNILGDVFAALSILFDKPFAVGDLIDAGAYSGTVVHIGIKSTRLRSVTGEQIILSNGELLKGGVRNYEQVGDRRAVFTVRVTPDTAEAKAREVPQIIRRVIESQPNARFGRAHFKTITDNSFEYVAVYSFPSGDYEAYLDAQQEINLRLLSAMREAGVRMLSQKNAPPALRSPENETASTPKPGI